MGVSRTRTSRSLRGRLLSALRRVSWAVSAGVVLGMTGGPAIADKIAGSDDPAYAEALALWLNADEEGALPALADLADGGNTAAQMLLGLIDKTGALQGPYLGGLDRETRIALLRRPGGLSGRNWMQAAAEDEPLADLWLRLWTLPGGIEIAEGFAQYGEARASREALLAEVSRTERGFPDEVIAQPWFPEALRHLRPARKLPMGEALSLPRGHPLRRFAGLPVPQNDLRNWLQGAELAQPLRLTCAKQCSSTQSACTLALYEALGSYHSLAMMGSPSASLIPERDFIESARGRQAVARRIMLMNSARVRASLTPRLAEIDTCAAEWLLSEYRSYYPSSSGAASDPAD